METGSLSLDIVKLAVIAVMVLTIFLFASDKFRVDVVAVMVLVLLGLSSLVPAELIEPIMDRSCNPNDKKCLDRSYVGLVPIERLFEGFSSNAVISIIAVMIIGAGMDKTGVLNRLANKILEVAGNTERKIMPLVAGTVGVISGFMQNIGAAALFLPVTDRISRKSGVPLNRLLMPMGYCAILGGTLTMVGSSPLILLNDLMVEAKANTPLEPFEFFAVTPIGIALLLVGIVYFAVFGRYVFPRTTTKSLETGTLLSYIQDTNAVTGAMFELRVDRESPIVGQTVGDVEDQSGYEARVIAVNVGGHIVVEPERNTEIGENSDIAMMGHYDKINEYAHENGLEVKKGITVFKEVFDRNYSGIAELVVMNDSSSIGKTMVDLGFRRNFRVTLMACFREGQQLKKDLANLQFQAGDSLVVHTRWQDLPRFADTNNFVIATNIPREDFREDKTRWAMLIFMLTLGLVISQLLPLSAALLVGAVGMILFGVITMDEAYRAIGWQSVFLLACLLPLGIALDSTGTAEWIANQFVELLHTYPPWVMLAALAVLATIFTLLMSNVGATVILVPIAISVAVQVGGNPAVFALTVALATSNSFLIPTHQVNALIQAPGEYSVKDFMRTGSIMSLLFLVVVLVMVQLMFGI